MPVTMYRVVLLVIFVAVASGDSEDMEKKCHTLEHPETMRCCKSGFSVSEMKMDYDLKECMELPHNPHSCERDICIGKKLGYATDDGTVDKEVFMKHVSEHFKSMPTFLGAIKQNCVDGDLKGAADACEVMKLRHCVHKRLIDSCTEWDNSGFCAGTSDLVKECSKMDS